MLENWKAFNAGFGLATGFEGNVLDSKAENYDSSLPVKLCPRADMPTGIVEHEFSQRPTATAAPTAAAAS